MDTKLLLADREMVKWKDSGCSVFLTTPHMICHLMSGHRIYVKGQIICQKTNL